MIGETEARTVLAAAVRAATGNSGDLANNACRGVDVIIDMTAVPGVDTVTFSIEGKDPVSGKWYTLLASAALVATGVVVLHVYPGATVTANLSANANLPRAWRVVATHSAATNFTYSVGANLLP